MGALITRSPEIASTIRFHQNATGSVPSSFDAWLALRGAKTLELRMRQHGLGALAVARWLASQTGRVAQVIYPGLEGKRQARGRALAWRQLSDEAREWATGQGFDEHSGFPYGGMVSFRIGTAGAEDDDSEVAVRFLGVLKVFTLAESLGGVESLAELPSRMTHASVTPEARAGSSHVLFVFHHQEKTGILINVRALSIIALGIDDRLVRLSVGIEDSRDLIRDLDHGLKFALGG
jgi:cystathionine gamma-lyase